MDQIVLKMLKIRKLLPQAFLNSELTNVCIFGAHKFSEIISIVHISMCDHKRFEMWGWSLSNLHELYKSISHPRHINNRVGWPDHGMHGTLIYYYKSLNARTLTHLLQHDFSIYKDHEDSKLFTELRYTVQYFHKIYSTKQISRSLRLIYNKGVSTGSLNVGAWTNKHLTDSSFYNIHYELWEVMVLALQS